MTFQDILNQIVGSVSRCAERPAFCFPPHTHSYREFGQAVSSIRAVIRKESHANTPVGVVLNDDFLTYAALVALWFEGKAYVPINTQLPVERNCSIVEQADISLFLNSGAPVDWQLLNSGGVKEVDISALPEAPLDLTVTECDESATAYILFTSGSTGVPKGVPISRANLASFMDGVDRMGLKFTPEDRFLQMFELTFDLSVWSFLQPLCVGASQYPIPHGEIKFMYAYELLEEQGITVALMVPSMLNFLRPYFEDLDFPNIRYSLFCGEALYGDVTKEWAQIVANAQIFNVYGPTEATIFCSYYEIPREGDLLASSGIVTIGQPLGDAQLMIVNEHSQPVLAGEKGELCIGGGQVMSGYLKNEPLTQAAFLEHEGRRFYRSGDICFVGESGDLLYCGRSDSQIKIQGFRVELSEIEFQSRAVVQPYGVAAVAIADHNGLFEVHLFVDQANLDVAAVSALLKQKLPAYMVPKQIHGIEAFPLNANGKIDRKQLKNRLATPISIRRAMAEDVDFLVEAVVNAEKSGTDVLSYSTIFNLDEPQVRSVLKAMIAENEGYCELSVDSFLIAEVHGVRAGAVAAWVEGADEVPSAIAKANLLFAFMPEESLAHLREISALLEEIHIQKINGVLQLESIYTVKEFRGLGISQKLIEKQIENAKAEFPMVNRAQIILSDVNNVALKAYQNADFELTLHKHSTNPLIKEYLPSTGNYSMEKTI